MAHTQQRTRTSLSRNSHHQNHQSSEPHNSNYLQPHHLSLTQWDNFFKAICNAGPFLLIGDFNALHPTWDCDTTNPSGENLHRLINKHNLIIHNTDTQSHVSHNQRKNSNLDLIITQANIAHFITTQQLEDTLGSDHYPIECTLNTEKHVYQKKTNRLSTTNTNWNGYKDDMDSLSITF